MASPLSAPGCWTMKAHGQLYFYEIDDENVMRTLYLYYRRESSLPAIYTDFLDFMDKNRQEE